MISPVHCTNLALIQLCDKEHPPLTNEVGIVANNMNCLTAMAEKKIIQCKNALVTK